MPNVEIVPARACSKQPVRTAAYARVSSSSDDQLNSFSAQIRYYTEMLNGRTDAVFVDMYADEGITGTTTDKREDFNRLMNDCRKGKIDRILTKSVSRFARNTKDCLETVRELKLLGISVYFEKENIETGELSSELLLALYSQFAQEESMSISRNVRMGVHKRMIEGTYRNVSVPFGFKYDNGKIIIDEQKAQTVKRIFSDYLNGIGLCQIARNLNAENVLCADDAEEWYPSTIFRMLLNEKYMGDSLLQKTVTTDSAPFIQTLNKGEKPKYYITNTHEPIICKETFEAVQSLLKSKSKPESHQKNIYPLSKMVQCGICGHTFRRKINRSRLNWVCRLHDHKSAEACPIKPISEESIYGAFVRMFNKLTAAHNQLFPPMIRQLEALSERKSSNNKQIVQIRHKIEETKGQAYVIAALKEKGTIDSVYYTAKKDELEHKMVTLKKRLHAMLDNDAEDRQIAELRQLNEIFENTEPLAEFDEALFAQAVEKIIVLSGNELRFRLTGGVEFTENIIRKGR